MDDEKLQRTMEFILNNQAQFTVEMQQIQEVNKDALKRFGTLERATLNLYNTSVKINESIEALTTDVKKLREGQKETSVQLRETDERLNAVILIVEKYLSRNDNKN